ncbi:MAG: UDP-glucose 4-epimerase GalE [Clostridiales bacterium]|jgi:UDP-glucose 4-epimerase|nr:UDP-glucose 4-epimerase GalE [Clostridiales bacterium]
MKVLVAGGAGYIGSTACSALLDAGHTPVILDSLVTGRAEFTRGRIFYQGDIADGALLARIAAEHPDISCAIHFAALIVVPNSVSDPYGYYRENVAKSLEFYHNLLAHGIRRVIFSSSASLYDDAPGFKVTEESPLNPRSPYARTKYMMETILRDFTAAYDMRALALRYFNPIGADPALRTGPQIKEPSHVLGKLVSVAEGALDEFLITGTDWPTRDGSGIRDYVHVWDLALAHVKAVESFDDALLALGTDYATINLGCGNGVTVKELVYAFEKVYGKTLKKREAPPRDGDVAGSYADAGRAAALLGWRAERGIEQGIEDALRWSRVRDSIIPD